MNTSNELKHFFLSRFSFTDTDDSIDNRRRKWLLLITILPTHDNLGIYMQRCMWDSYHVFLIASYVVVIAYQYLTTTRWDLLLRICNWLIIKWMLFSILSDDLILDFFAAI